MDANPLCSQRRACIPSLRLRRGVGSQLEAQKGTGPGGITSACSGQSAKTLCSGLVRGAMETLTVPRRPIAGTERGTGSAWSVAGSILAEDGVSTSRGAHEEGTVGGTERTPSWRHVPNGHKSLKQGTCGVDSAFGSGQGWHTMCSRVASAQRWPKTRFNYASVSLA